MKIKVTQKDINRGERVSGSKCPIALATKRKIKKRVWVSNGDIEIRGLGKKPIIKKLPVKASNFINSFDYGHKVKPFEFEV